MKVYLTGATGMLGSDLTRALLEEDFMVKGTGSQELDIRDLNAVIREIEDCAPDVVVNCAAYTNVDGAETDARSAYLVNAIGAKNLAIACEGQGCALAHISTDYVFDGEKGAPYLEDDVPNPQCVYGRSKLAGENSVKSLMNRYFIIRTQWLYGKNGKNFVRTMLSLAEKGNPITVVDDQYGSPTYTKDLARAVREIVKTSSYGVYHVTNSGVCSWYEFARAIFEISGAAADLKPCTSAEFIRPAKRPPFSALENFNLELCGFEKLRHYKEALADYLKEEADR